MLLCGKSGWNMHIQSLLSFSSVLYSNISWIVSLTCLQRCVVKTILFVCRCSRMMLLHNEDDLILGLSQNYLIFFCYINIIFIILLYTDVNIGLTIWGWIIYFDSTDAHAYIVSPPWSLPLPSLPALLHAPALFFPHHHDPFPSCARISTNVI